MFKVIIKFFDFVVSLVLSVIFLLIIGFLLILPKFRKASPGKLDGIVQLYISIIDFRDSVLSTYKDDILLDGFLKKAFCFHFDFEKTKDENLPITKEIHMTNISVHPDRLFTRIGFRKSMACVVEIKTFFAMLRTILKEKANIIRAHDPHLLGFNAYMLSRITKIPFIVQICSNYELKDRQAKGITFRPFIFKSVERWFERSIMRFSDMVMTDREHYRLFGVISKEIPSERYTNIGFFVDAIHYVPPERRKDIRKDLCIGEDKKILLYVGRLCEVKYPLDLLKIFELCLEKRKDMVFLIAGEGVLKPQMEQIVREKRMDDNILFLNQIPQENLPDLYYTADVVSFTSAGFTMLEAALAERCIVAYDFEWHSEFIGNNERGILVPFGNYHKFANEILNLLDNLQLRKKLGKSARYYTLKHYIRESSIAKEIASYKRIFEKRRYTTL